MLFAAPLVLSLLVALAAAAGLPSAAGDIPKALRRGTARSHATPPVELLDKGVATGYTAQNVKGTTWTGAAYFDFPNGTFTRVTGTIVAPTLRIPPGGANGTEYHTSAWVGIDGWSDCTDAILQTGVDFFFNGTDMRYEAWYEYYPDPTQYFSPIEIQPGDELRFTIVATNMTAGTARIENLSRNISLISEVSQTLTRPKFPLCAGGAEWIIEDLKHAGPFADFGSLTFSNATATIAPGGAVIGPQYATLIDMYQNDRKLTEASSGLWNVTVNYVG